MRGRPGGYSLDARRSRKSFRSDVGNSHRLGDRSAAEPWLVGQLWAGDDEPKPPGVCRAGAVSAVRGRTGLVVGLPARLSPGHAGDARRGPDPECEAATWHGRIAGAGAGLDAVHEPEAPAIARGRPAARGADQVVRDGFRHA